MDAYHNADWPECYDLWVRHLFGAGPSEDVPIFRRVLQDVLRNRVQNEPPQSSAKPQYLNIVDIGTGTGRVLCDLFDFISNPDTLPNLETSIATSELGFRLWGTEPSATMLARANALVTAHCQKPSDDPPRPKRTRAPPFQLGWCRCSAVDFSSTMRQTFGFRDEDPALPGFADLIIFAAGGSGHLVSPDDVRNFLIEVADALKPGHGRAVVSVLRELLPAGETQNSEAAVEVIGNADALDATALAKPSEKPDKVDQLFRVRSIDSPDQVFVKHPPTERWDGDVRTDSFILDVEDLEGRVLRTHNLEWKSRRFDPDTWNEAVRDAVLEVAEIIDGEIQLWYVLRRNAPLEA
ncbi:hypothetical protein W97_06901 [Coniosporium apollinis CBS 100218]|uniref:Methyltransferase domain-containing protein n=1 Tax=Coniosporium apollinis (strain CBS 100218) TaxID=1168221 RepID=R7Z0C2_CONA1|nr:uncharacterized protein W97_06901 [Coniosporium apollinis CBS 100218]EON67533.1 hypothetical protein W97_06901 [Coniosporium apollinis CBS 100218]